MSNIKSDKKPDILAVTDRRENITQMEPMALEYGSKHKAALTDLSLELAAHSEGFKRSLPPGMVSPLADIVRSMNCYYSNLIEGHNTHPVDIERALKQDFSKDKGKRNLQLEAKAHIETQKWIDDGGLVKGAGYTEAGICEIHRRFYELLPEDLCWVENPETKNKAKVIPGKLRHLDIRVGKHVAISPGAVPRFLLRFEQFYSSLGKSDSIISAAAAHHRLAWIHPFLDGNGRVLRLMSHAIMLEKLDTGALWSIARGLARNADDYKSHLASCDSPRHGDLDGRGNLSEEALAAFTKFFLTTCLDQISFMEKLMQPDRLRSRVLFWAKEEIDKGKLLAKSSAILEALLYRGELPRESLAGIVGTGERQARRIVADLLALDIIRTESNRAPLKLNFPAAFVSEWMPGLYG